MSAIERPIGLEQSAEGLVAALEPVLAALRAGLALPPHRQVRDEVGAVARRVAAAPTLGALGNAVGLSPTRLREVVRADLGVTLGRLRLWQRLLTVADDVGSPLVDRAVRAGFSDQAHMTRTARSLVGRTPTEVLARR